MEKSTSKPIVQNDADTSASFVSLIESPRKCNLSFSINFDFNDVDSENSTDSENADLQIDISEVDNYEPSSKHKREAIEEAEASVLYKMEEEIERQLDAKAAKTNLTATNVKNILKHVLPYEHLMTMIQKWLQDTEDDVNFGPKLTRAKAKYVLLILLFVYIMDILSVCMDTIFSLFLIENWQLPRSIYHGLSLQHKKLHQKFKL